MGVLLQFAICGLAGATIYLDRRPQDVSVAGRSPGQLLGAGDARASTGIWHRPSRSRGQPRPPSIARARCANYDGPNVGSEGIVSAIPAIGKWVFGLLAGDLLALRRPLRDRLLMMAGVGAMLAVGMCATGGYCNKNSGPAFAVFWPVSISCCSRVPWLVDGLGWQTVRPFVILGMTRSRFTCVGSLASSLSVSPAAHLSNRVRAVSLAISASSLYRSRMSS
jgi:hypothetical protein